MNRFSKLFQIILPAFVALSVIASPASRASDVDSVTGLLKNAAATENKAAFNTILQMALETWPNKRQQILATAETVQPKWMHADQAKELQEIRQAAMEAEKASRARGILYYLDPVLWNAQAELGAGSSTGDTDEKAISAGLSFHRNFGEKWEHDLDLNFDFASSEGATTRQKFVTKYEALWRVWDSLFLVSYTELELDKFSGYDYRVLQNLGIGMDVFKTKRQSLRLEGGPGVRFSKLDLTGEKDTEYLGRVSGTYNLKLTNNLNLRDRFSVVFGNESTTLANKIGLSAQINSHLSARLSFETSYDSAPPLGTSAWDTSTRATLVYGF